MRPVRDATDHPVARLRGVTKAYGRGRRAAPPPPVLDGLSLDLHPFRTTAVLGPNGSGKTTLFRVLLGLTRPDAGSVELFGHSVVDGLRHGGGVGAVIETPRFPPRLTGRRALDLLARVWSLPGPRVGEVLDQVGLLDAADRRIGGYSLGMRQRLGIAAALLPGPALLILDEPANGLDPTGIADLRAVLQAFVVGGGTVLFSSHALVEVEHLADRLVILDRGVCPYAGSIAGFGGRTDPWWRVGLESSAGPLRADQLRFVLEPLVSELTLGRFGARVRLPGRVADLTRRLAEQSVWVTELTPEWPTLEEQYLRWFGAPGADGAAAGSDAARSGERPGRTAAPRNESACGVDQAIDCTDVRAAVPTARRRLSVGAPATPVRPADGGS